MDPEAWWEDGLSGLQYDTLVIYVHRYVCRGHMFDSDAYRPDEALIGNSSTIHRICDQLQKAALTEVPVLITGESGTGKELAARLLHSWSSRRANRFLKVSCPAISHHFFENELYSYDQQSLPRATFETKVGRCEQADKGTLFLDEVGELDQSLQPKLLYALQDFEVVRLGGTGERPIDIRLVCATNRDLEAEVAKGHFRIDLFYRINVVRIQMPPLRERISDVPILMDHFIRLYSESFRTEYNPLRSSFVKMLESYRWPGNIRELENMAKRYVVMGGEEHVLSVIRQPEELRPLLPEAIDLTTPLRVQTKRATQNLERKIILGVLEAHNWNRRKTARSLDISYRALLYKIKEVGLPSGQSIRPILSKAAFQSSGNDVSPENPAI
jgi:two-component system response regulator AtoC